MANTVSILSYANTFGDWLVATNAIGKEHNDLVSNNWTKSTGTIYLNDSSLGLQVAAAAIFAGAFQVQGTGSTAYIQNNLRVDGTIQSTNTSNSIFTGGPITALGKVTSNATGLGLYIANNATIAGIANAANLFVTNSTTTGNLQVQYAATTSTLQSNTTGNFGTSLVVGTTISSGGQTYASAIQANTTANIGTSLVVGTTMSSGGAAWHSSVQANTTANIGTSAVIGTTLSAGGGAWVNALTSNTAANIGTALLVGTTATVVGKTYTDALQANNGITTTNISGTGTAFMNVVQANTSVNTRTLSVTGTGSFDTIIANTAFTSPAAAGQLYSLAVGVGGMTVAGTFTINGATVYNTPTFTLSALTPLSKDNNGSVNFTAYRVVGNSANTLTVTQQIAANVANVANATLRFNNSNNYWELANTSANTLGYATSNGYFYRILTQELIDNSGTQSTIASANIASAYLANVLNTAIQTANTFNQANTLTARLNAEANTGAALAAGKVYTDTANTSLKLYTDNLVSTANSSLKSYTDNTISTANTSLKSYTDNLVSTANSSLKSYTDNSITNNAINPVTAAYARANTAANTFNGTTGQALPNAGVITFSSNNGFVISGTANTLYLNSAQDLQTTASPTFAGLTLSGKPTSPTPATNTSNTMIATTAFVQNQLNNGNVYQHTSNVSNFHVVVDDTITNATMYPVWVTTTGANVALKTSTTNLYFNPSTGSVSATIFNALSDENRKQNILPIIDALSTVKQIEGVGFNWKDNGKKSYGHIAQKLEEILPELVDTNSEGVKSVNYNGIIAFLVESIKEMDKRITELESK